MCAGTVVEPVGETSAAIESVTSRSRSVAFRLSLPRSALTSTFARTGMVLRRSTTRCTCPSDFKSSARSTVTFMGTRFAALKKSLEIRRCGKPALAECEAGGQRCRASTKIARVSGFRRVLSPGRSRGSEAAIRARPGPSPAEALLAQTNRRRLRPAGGPAARFYDALRPGHGVKSIAVYSGLLLQLSLEDFDLLSQCHVVADEALDLAHRVQHGGVVAATETPPDFR